MVHTRPDPADGEEPTLRQPIDIESAIDRLGLVALDIKAQRDELIAALKAIVTGLDVPRNRFGKLDGDLATSNPLANLCVAYKLPHGGQDIAEAAVMVARAAIAKAEGA